jgi:hypothetical protein
MIELANDPNASRMGWRAKAQGEKSSPNEPRRGRTGHSWPFLSPHAARLEQRPGGKNPSNDSGS